MPTRQPDMSACRSQGQAHPDPLHEPATTSKRRGGAGGGNSIGAPSLRLTCIFLSSPHGFMSPAASTASSACLRHTPLLPLAPSATVRTAQRRQLASACAGQHQGSTRLIQLLLGLEVWATWRPSREAKRQQETAANLWSAPEQLIRGRAKLDFLSANAYAPPRRLHRQGGDSRCRFTTEDGSGESHSPWQYRPWRDAGEELRSADSGHTD